MDKSNSKMHGGGPLALPQRTCPCKCHVLLPLSIYCTLSSRPATLHCVWFHSRVRVTSTRKKGRMAKREGRTCGARVQCYLILLAFWLSCSAVAHAEGVRASASGPVVKKAERRAVVSTEYGEISAVRIDDAINGSYLLHFFSLEPNSLLLPLVLNADMLFYVRAGN